ncbi:heavy metal sensor histidine kinase [Niveibacterium sp. SC-1]|uniref:heavy metal sensor histidine kinase n=1 Tax=Niveibacterium sp. SC-1 TaxID=3135646 RepID=UPI00311E0434
MRLPRIHSIVLRLTLAYALASSAVLTGMAIVISRSVETHFEEQDGEALEGKLELIRHAAAEVRSEAALAALAKQLDDALVGHQELEVAVLSQRGQPLYITSGGVFPERMTFAGKLPEVGRVLSWGVGEQSFRGLVAHVKTGSPDLAPLTVIVATGIVHHQHFMQAFRRSLWGFVILATGVSGLLGWFVARRGLLPVAALTEAARNVTARRLNRRLSISELPGELRELAAEFNQMLERLEDAFQRLSGFSSDIAHELRTPISNLMTQTQVALSRSRTPEEYQDALHSNVEEFERLARMVNDMLFLAKADNGLVIPKQETIDLASEVADVFAFYEALAESRGLCLSMEGVVPSVMGDRLMLRRALNNLVANAIRYASEDSAIDVRLAREADTVLVSVENRGPTIPPEIVDRLFDRFFRADPARSQSSEGAGLGLAITRSIVLAHRGTLTARSQDEQTVFEIRLPVGATPA